MTALPQLAEYKPGAWYFRKALRESETREAAVEIGMQAVLEIETLRAFIRGHGFIPPKDYILESEALDKGWEVQDELRFTS